MSAKEDNGLIRFLRISMGRIHRKDVLTYLFFVILAAVFWIGVTMHDMGIALDDILRHLFTN